MAIVERNYVKFYSPITQREYDTKEEAEKAELTENLVQEVATACHLSTYNSDVSEVVEYILTYYTLTPILKD